MKLHFRALETFFVETFVVVFIASHCVDDDIKFKHARSSSGTEGNDSTFLRYAHLKRTRTHTHTHTIANSHALVQLVKSDKAKVKHLLDNLFLWRILTFFVSIFFYRILRFRHRVALHGNGSHCFHCCSSENSFVNIIFFFFRHFCCQTKRNLDQNRIVLTWKNINRQRPTTRVDKERVWLSLVVVVDDITLVRSTNAIIAIVANVRVNEPKPPKRKQNVETKCMRINERVDAKERRCQRHKVLFFQNRCLFFRVNQQKFFGLSDNGKTF